MATEIKLLNWNANGLSKNTEELEELIVKRNIDIALINETHLNKTKTITLPGMITYRSDRLSRKASGGTAIFIKKNINHSQIKLPTLQELEATAIDINLRNGNTIRLVAAYKKPRNNLREEDILKVLDDNTPSLLAGDLNAKNTAWGCRHTNQNGRKLQQYLQAHNWMICAPDQPTHLAHNLNQESDILDIVILNNFPYPINQEVLHKLNSDHLPVLIKMRTAFSINCDPDQHQINWKEFRHKMAIMQPLKTPTTSTIEAVNDHIQLITQTIQKCIIESKIHTQKKNYNNSLPKHISDLIKERNRTRKYHQRTWCPTAKRKMNALQHEITELLLERRQEIWAKYTENLILKDNSLWTATKKLRKESFNFPTIETNNGPATTDQEKAEALATQLEHQFKPHPSSNNVESQNEEHLVELILDNRPTQKPEEASIEELQAIIESLPPKKAPGYDDINNTALKNLNQDLKVQLLWVINQCLRLAYFPDFWKFAIVLAFPKPGKDHSKADAYRPISLLCTMGKLLEKIMLHRISDFLEIHHVIPNEQYGFRASHETIQQIWRLTEKINLGFTCKQDTAAVFLDVAKAFDSVWHQGMIMKLWKINTKLTGKNSGTKWPSCNH